MMNKLAGLLIAGGGALTGLGANAETLKMPRGALHQSDHYMMLALKGIQEAGAKVVVDRDLYSAESNSLFGNNLRADQICFTNPNTKVSFHPSLVNRINLVSGGETGFIPSQQKTDEYVNRFPAPLKQVLQSSGYMSATGNPTGIFYEIKASWFIDTKLATPCSSQDITDAKLEYLAKFAPNQRDLDWRPYDFYAMFNHVYTHSPITQGAGCIACNMQPERLR